MIIKHTDDHQADIDTLTSLQSHPEASEGVKKKIGYEIGRIKAGHSGETAAAYELDRLFGKSEKTAVIHDLRLVVGGQIAQIDHLLLTRTMAAYVCETKNFSEGLACNDHGEWVGFRGSKPYGIASPLYQGKRHCELLNDFLAEGHAWHPRRLGKPIGIIDVNFVLVSNRARISRPKSEKAVADMERVVKIEAFADAFEKHVTSRSTMGMLSKVIGADTLKTFAEGLAACHVPAETDWHAKYGLTPIADAPDGKNAAKKEKSGKKLVCKTCKAKVPYNVGKFCWQNEARFGGDTYCRECQAAIA